MVTGWVQWFLTIRVRGEIMGPGKYEDVGKSQSVILMMINPMISAGVLRVAAPYTV
jgi:hypothetical protein